MRKFLVVLVVCAVLAALGAVIWAPGPVRQSATSQPGTAPGEDPKKAAVPGILQVAAERRATSEAVREDLRRLQEQVPVRCSMLDEEAQCLAFFQRIADDPELAARLRELRSRGLEFTTTWYLTRLSEDGTVVYLNLSESPVALREFLQ